MRVRLIDLRGVLEDEAEELRTLLTDNGIDYYESPAGNWGISVPAIWLYDESQLQAARGLVQRYQDERLKRTRAEYEQLKREGKQVTIADKVRENPLQFLIYLAAILLVLYLSINPFLEIGS